MYVIANPHKGPIGVLFDRKQAQRGLVPYTRSHSIKAEIQWRLLGSTADSVFLGINIVSKRWGGMNAWPGAAT